MELLLVFTIPIFAYGLSILMGVVVIRNFGGYPGQGLPYPNWSQSFKYAFIAESFAFAGLYLAAYGLQHWGHALPVKHTIAGFWTIETLFVWVCATMFSNAIELFILRAWFGIFPRWGLVFSLGIVNALCSWPELAHKLKIL